MRERIHQLAGGRTDITQPSLELLVTSIEETLAAGQNYRGDIRITSLGVVIGAHCGPGLLTVFYLCDGRRPE